MNGIGIKDAEEFKQLYEKDPGIAIGLLFENISDLRKARKKNVAVQFAGGVTGGVVTAWAFVKAYACTLLDK